MRPVCQDSFQLAKIHFSAGGPLKPGFGLSGEVRPPDRVCSWLVPAFSPSTRIQLPPGLRSPLRTTENCSTPRPHGMCASLRSEHFPTQAKCGLEWASRPVGAPLRESLSGKLISGGGVCKAVDLGINLFAKVVPDIFRHRNKNLYYFRIELAS